MSDHPPAPIFAHGQRVRIGELRDADTIMGWVTGYVVRSNQIRLYNVEWVHDGELRSGYVEPEMLSEAV